MFIKKAFKFRIYPNKEQQEKLTTQFGHARFVYNWALARRKEHYEATGTGLSHYDINYELTKLKRQPDTVWLQQASAQVLQQKSIDLQRAYINFFEGCAKYPKFKSRKARRSIRYQQNFKVEGNKVYLPKVGWVKAVIHRRIEGKMKNCTVSKTNSGRYFVSIQCEVEIDEPIYGGDQIGIDLGLIDFVTTSDGQTVPAPKFLRRSEQKLKRLQRQLSRRRKGGKGREKARLALARQAEKVANQRRDFQHKLSRKLVEQHRLVGFENLNVAGMLKNHHLAKSIHDASWSEFVRQCQYKGEWYGCRVEKVGRFFPSSKLCSNCGEKHQSLKLSERKWVCVGCGTVHKRDENAAINILNELRYTVGATGINADGEVVRPEVTLPTPAASLKSEAAQL